MNGRTYSETDYSIYMHFYWLSPFAYKGNESQDNEVNPACMQGTNSSFIQPGACMAPKLAC